MISAQNIVDDNTAFGNDKGDSESSLHGLHTDGHDPTQPLNENANELLKNIRVKNVNRITIGSLNINSISSKFDQLKEIIGNHLDILTIQETKIDSSFPEDQFLIDGYSKPYRLDRNRNGGGVLIYIREDIPSKPLNKHKFTKGVEGLFIEINLRKMKLLFLGAYRSEHQEYGLSGSDFFEQINLALDVYSSYDKFLLAGDFNTDVGDEVLEDFLNDRNAKNLVKEKTCFKSIENPGCIDLFIYRVDI